MIFVILAVIVLLLIVFFIWQNNAVDVDEYVVESPALPEELDGCRIVQLSDLHNKRYGEDQKRLVELLEQASPDLILITGDLIDKRRTKDDSWGNALSLVRQAAEFAPVFYVSGNHEWESGLYKKLRPQLETLGAEVLDDGFTVLDHGDAAMAVLGISDPAAFSKNVKAGRPMKKEELPACAGKVRERLEWLCEQQEEKTFQVLIAHRPQLVGMYAAAGVHLVFSGHAHGGQVRLPKLGALYAPDQGWLPKYTEGPYIQGNTVMIVSRGLGNSSCPIRILDKPQIVVVTLRAPKPDEEAEAQETGPDEVMEEAVAASFAAEAEAPESFAAEEVVQAALTMEPEDSEEVPEAPEAEEEIWTEVPAQEAAEDLEEDSGEEETPSQAETGEEPQEEPEEASQEESELVLDGAFPAMAELPPEDTEKEPQ